LYDDFPPKTGDQFPSLIAPPPPSPPPLISPPPPDGSPPPSPPPPPPPLMPRHSRWRPPRPRRRRRRRLRIGWPSGPSTTGPAFCCCGPAGAKNAIGASPASPPGGG